jgi:hypothetical protein
MNKKLALTMILSIIIIAGLSAWSITDDYFGNRFGILDARSYAMGSTGVYNALRPSAITLNPANLTLINRPAGLEGSFFLDRNEDNRAVPLYNSFDSYIDDSVYASNLHFYDDYAGSGFISFNPWKLRLGVGAYYQPLLNFDGNYEEEIRNNRNTDNDNYPEKIAVNTITNEGVLNQASGVLCIGYNLGENADFNLGFDFGKLWGKTKYQKDIHWTQWAIDTVGEGVLPDSSYIENVDLDGYRFKVGMSAQVNKRVGIGATYTFKTILDRTIDWTKTYGGVEVGSTTDAKEDYIIPSEFRLGINYQPRNIIRTWFNIEGEYVRFSELGDQYKDAINFYAGVEHNIKYAIPFRFGFQATNSYLRTIESDNSIIVKRIITPMITGGSSIPLTDKLHLDLGFGYSWREYEAIDLFRDSYYDDRHYTGENSYQLWPNQYIVLKDRAWENPDKVRESNISLSTSLSYTW